MSLIQEALQRQREDEGQTAIQPPPSPLPAASLPGIRHPPKLAVQPPAAPAVPPAPPVPPHDKSAPVPETKTPPPVVLDKASARRPWRALAAIVILLTVLIGVGVWMVLFAVQRWRQSVKTAGVEVSPAVAPAVVPRTTGTTPAEPTNSVTATSAALVARSSPPVPKTLPPPVAATAAAKPPPAKPLVKWPSINLTGSVGGHGGGSAMINGVVVAVGETIEGVTVKGIRNQGVELEFSGETRFLKVGNALP